MGEYDNDRSGKSMMKNVIDEESKMAGNFPSIICDFSFDSDTADTHSYRIQPINNGTDSDGGVSLCLKRKERYTIDVMARKNIRIRLIVEELSEVNDNEYVDEKEGVVLQKDTDLLTCSIMKIKESLNMSPNGKGDSALYMWYDEVVQDEDDDRTLDIDDFMMTTTDGNADGSSVMNSSSSKTIIDDSEIYNSDHHENGIKLEIETCQLCGKSFVGSSDFKNHMKIHTETSISSATSANTIKKQQVEKKETGDSIKLEDTKDQKRNRIEGLVESLRSQKLSVVSDENFEVRTVLNNQADTRSITKKKCPCKCNVCGKEFLYQKSYQKHIEMHSLTKPQKDSVSNSEGKDLETGDFDDKGPFVSDKRDSIEDEFSDYDGFQNEFEIDTEEGFDCDDMSKDPDFIPGRGNVNQVVLKVRLKQKLETKQEGQKENTDSFENGTKSQPKKEVFKKKKIKKEGDMINLPKMENGLYPCGLCGKTFTQSGSRKEHMNTHMGERPFKCKLCPKSYCWSGNLRGHVKRVHSSERPFQCTVCGRGYIEKNQLNKHMKIHSGVRPYKCKVCGRGFLEKVLLRNHVIIHTGIKPHVCKICGRKFSLAGYLREHSKIHSSERNFICDICGKQYTRGEHLRVHKTATHSVGKPFSCETCGKSFSASFRLKMHMRIHAKSVICEVCGKSFTSTSGLNAHMPMHTGAKPYECEICGKKFRWQGGYRKHKWIHLDYKAHACNICGNRFATKMRFRDHMNTHTGEKPYKCKLCTSKFGHYNCLRRHYKNLHALNMQDIKTFPEVGVKPELDGSGSLHNTMPLL